MTITLNRADDDPLSRRFGTVEARLAAAEDDLRDLHLLEAVRLIRGPLPAAAELIVDVDPSDRTVTLDAVLSAQELLYAHNNRGADTASYRTDDGATFGQVIRAVEQALESVLEDCHPELLWLADSVPNLYHVALAAHDRAQRLLSTPTASTAQRTGAVHDHAADPHPPTSAEAGVDS